ncbi:hypothetical protein KSS87_016861 [Heliosperma pusillum]|nr:hypothetical protein KSS87_016861 [Heliosperma pusillum]
MFPLSIFVYSQYLPLSFFGKLYTYFNHITPLQYPTIPIVYLILITLSHNNNYFNHFTPQ